ncbi:hypothetical protein AMTRI_Chr05g69480 [Amborella trichopoda]|uniref:Uncharacterized protein n=1 Tax=Amborella trichopoda TaxID=13333 RepID=W1NFK9_AMBTC|nr:uncharacterized protein LOC110006691 [Amborella trichopoda]ERM93965.1 hypothetical protein AMTR_s00136p00023930 [Amborella trichopoda]|eukprot:XP_020518777.1 uncharacterized protein LOC110006691 [Amborella trichopoda]
MAEEWLLQGDEEEEVLGGEEGGFGEDAVMEVMKRLEAEITRSGSSSSGDTHTFGNQETCGASFSDSKSTVMASIDMAGLVFQMPSSSKTEDFGVPIPTASEPFSIEEGEDADDSSWWVEMMMVGDEELWEFVFGDD